MLASRVEDDESDVTANDPGRLIVPVGIVDYIGNDGIQANVTHCCCLEKAKRPIFSTKLEKM